MARRGAQVARVQGVSPVCLWPPVVALLSVSLALQAPPVAPCRVRSRLPYKPHASDKTAVMGLAGRQKPLSPPALSEGDG